MVAKPVFFLGVLLTSMTGALSYAGLLRSMASVPAPTSDPVIALLRQNQIISEVVDDFEPTVNITLSYGGKEYPVGSQIDPAAAKEEPALSYTGLKNDTLYTLVMTDPGVLPVTPSANAWQWLHWIRVNMAMGSNASEVVMPYSGPNPPTGNHRYAIIMFEQTNGTIAPTTPKERGSWDTRAFAVTNGLKPVGATFFYSQNPPKA